MKSKLFSLLILTICVLCLSSCRRTYNKPFREEIKVIKIDSIENTYIIYAKKSTSEDSYMNTFRILSEKGKNNCSNKIEKDKVYNVSLLDFMIQGMPSNETSLNFNGTEILVKEKDVSRKIYASKNLKGLCYKRFVLKRY